MKGLILASAAIVGSGLGLKSLVNDGIDVNESITAAREGIVVVRVPGGAVRIEGWDRNEVRVTGTIPAGDDRFDLTSDHGHVEVIVIPDLGADPFETDITVMVPQRSSLDIETDAAAVSVDAVSGVVRLATYSGNITVGGNPMGIVARSETGDIDIAAERTPGIAHSEEGTVRLRGGAQGMVADRMTRRMEDRMRRLECRRASADRCERSEQYGRENGRPWKELGHEIGSMVQSMVQDLDLHLNVDDYGDGFTFEFSGDVGLDMEDLENMFEDLEDYFEDFGDELGDTMVELSEELERLGEDLQENHRRRSRGRN